MGERKILIDFAIIINSQLLIHRKETLIGTFGEDNQEIHRVITGRLLSFKKEIPNLFHLKQVIPFNHVLSTRGHGLDILPKRESLLNDSDLS